jgi:1-acyl-sn-glycerol-3-phosphate acyltransferase
VATFLERWQSNLVRLPLMVAATGAYGTVSLAASFADKSGAKQHALARAWAQALLRISGCNVTVVGGENLRVTGPAVFVANHISYMDTPVIFAKLPMQFRILAREGLFKIPFMGWHLKRSGQVPVAVGDAYSSMRSMSAAVKVLRGGMPVMIFPEGGRSESGKVEAFMSGPAYLGIRTGAPIIPMALIGTHEALPVHVYHLTPKPLMLIVGEPIKTDGMTMRDIDALTLRLHDRIAEMYEEWTRKAHGDAA